MSGFALSTTSMRLLLRTFICVSKSVQNSSGLLALTLTLTLPLTLTLTLTLPDGRGR